MNLRVFYLTRRGISDGYFSSRPNPPQEQGSHCEIPNSKPVSKSGGRDERIWEQRRTNLGRRTLVSRPTFAERNRD